ncbi:MAG: hypothetical protein PHG08_00290 [Bacilli bacterium]|nr:hypothetical protein [Bacilli bacterium]
MNYSVKLIQNKHTHPFIMNIHYAKRIPSISFAYGLFDDDELIGIVTYGQPGSPAVTKNVMGENYKDRVLELNRLCLLYNRKNEASFLVSHSLKLLPRPKCIVSYSDHAENHVGIVYQACNFIFTGTTPQSYDFTSKNGTHPRHCYDNKDGNKIRVIRSAKNRYVYFIGSRSEIKTMKKLLLYPILPYPKIDQLVLIKEEKLEPKLTLDDWFC